MSSTADELLTFAERNSIYRLKVQSGPRIVKDRGTIGFTSDRYLWISIPVVVKTSWDGDGSPVIKQRDITIVQLQKEDKNAFGVMGQFHGIVRLLYDGGKLITTHIQKLMDGETIRYHAPFRREDGKLIEDPTQTEEVTVGFVQR